ncbi:MAG: TIM barrel protein [archaeon]
MAYINSSTESFYQGYSSLDPDYGDVFTGYRIPISNIGSATGTRTANQLAEVNARIREGLGAVEVQFCGQSETGTGMDQSIPREHLKEINRLAKLNKVNISVHAPFIDPSGFTDKGWTEQSKDESRRRLWDAVDRASELDPNGNVPVTIHASHVPGTDWVPGKTREEQRQAVYVVNQETKQLAKAEREIKEYPHGQEKLGPQDQIDAMNQTTWLNSLTQATDFKQKADSLVQHAWPLIAPEYVNILEGKKKISDLAPEQQMALNQVNQAEIFYREMGATLNGLFDKAYRYGDDAQKKKLEKIRKELVDYDEELIKQKKSPVSFMHRMQEGDNLIQKFSDPSIQAKTFIPVEQFAMKHTADNLSDIALKAYEKYGKKAPIISLEHVAPGLAFGRAEELKGLINKTREEIAIKARAKGYSSEKASQIAQQMVGATWDTGHINLLRSKGFTKEDIVKETKSIAPLVKHVHFTDNFGYEDSHLGPGMGNAPFKEMFEELKKEGFKGRFIGELPGAAVPFKMSPTPQVLQAFGSPLYSMQMQPYWNQAPVATFGDYSSGYGMMLPEQHFSIYSAGWSALPAELGGQQGGKGQRFSGRPME